MNARLACAVAASIVLQRSIAVAGEQQVMLRAVGPHVSSEVVQYIARNAKAQEISGASGKTPREIITSLCGSFRLDYYEEFRRLNKIATPTPDTPLSESADSLQLPACLYVANLPNDFVVKPKAVSAGTLGTDERLAIYKMLTGGDGTAKVIKHFFKPSKTIAGDSMLKPKFLTGPVQVTPKNGTVKEFVQSVNALTRRTNKVADAKAVVRATLSTDISNGEIITGLGNDSSANGDIQSSDSLECQGDEARAFEEHALGAAYAYAAHRASDLHRARKDVTVSVVDNGFFGANPENPPEFKGYFPEAFFPNTDTLGVKVGDAWPINYENGMGPGDITEESGHGTHVVGLILGGPSLLDQRQLFLRSATMEPWLRLNIINIGKGGVTLMPNSVELLSFALSKAPEHDLDGIVNMSIAYDVNATPGISTTFRDLFQHRFPNLLFVAAAGNNYAGSVSAHWFPAAFGGAAMPNVITVAAHNGAGALTRFSNRGVAVDIAAPGCGIHSWLDENGRDAKLSGTSQAAPYVTFSAALLKSIAGDLEPQDVKTRLLVSGDLLAGSDYMTIRSQSKLNAVKALFLFDDYLRLRGPRAPAYLGQVSTIRNLKCPSEQQPMSRSELLAFKHDDAHSRDVIFYTPESPVLCDWPDQNNSAGGRMPELHFTAYAELSPEGDVLPCTSPGPCTGQDYAFKDVQELVMSGPYTTQQ